MKTERNIPETAELESFPEKYWVTHSPTRTYQGKLHFHKDYYELYLFLEGDVMFFVEGERYHLNPGDLFLISPGTMHKAMINQEVNYNRTILHLQRDVVKSLGTEKEDLIHALEQKKNRLYHLDPASVDQVCAFADQIRVETDTKQFGQTILLRSLFTQTIIYCLRKTAQMQAAPKQLPPRIQQIINYINLHLPEQFTLDTMAASLSVSKSQLSHEFRKYYGDSLWNYVITRRLSRAQQLLLSGKSVTEACFDSGFANYSHFIKTFKKELGETPKQFVNSARRGETIYLDR